MNNKSYLVILMLLLVVYGCSSNGVKNPVTAGNFEPGKLDATPQITTENNNRYMIGYWDVFIPDDHSSIELFPLRTTDMHFNAVRWLEETPCSTCLTVENIMIMPSGLLSAGFRLQHPFPGLDRFNGFDVRGIFISGGNYTFPYSEQTISWFSDDHPRMVNYDGYTDLFNPTDFPEDLPVPPCLKYVPGNRSTGGDLSATLNPFVAYQTWEPRRMFVAGAAETHQILLDLPDGPIWFGYAVDVSWHPVEGELIDPIEDFPPEANSLEPYSIQVEVGKGIWNGLGGESEISIIVHDWQGINGITGAVLEAPDLFGALTLLSFFYIDENTGIFRASITNQTGIEPGHYPLLVRVFGNDDDPNLGWRSAFTVYDLHDVGQSDGWARTWGDTGDDHSYAVDVDSQADIYVAGMFEGTVDFNPDLDEDEFRSANGEFDTYLAKYNKTGDFLWVRTWGGEESGTFEEPANIVAVDNFDEIYVIGSFAGTCDFDPGPEIDSHTSTDQNIFLTKFDSTGEHLWVKTWGSSGVHDIGFGVNTDDDNNVFATGTFRGTCDMDPGPAQDFHGSNGSIDVFVSKFTSYGSFIWSRTFGGIVADQSRGIDTDVFGNVYVGGCFERDVDFAPGSDENWITAIGEADAYITTYDTDGNYRWTKTIGGPEIDVSRSVHVNNLRIYLAGTYRAIAKFDDSLFYASQGGKDGFVTAYDLDGNLTETYLVSGPGTESCSSVNTDWVGRLLITGPFSQDADLDPSWSGEDIRDSFGLTDAYVIKLNTYTNTPEWISTWGGPEHDRAWCVAVDNFANIYTSGWFAGTPDFDPSDGIYEVPSNGEIDSFLHMMPPSGTW